MFGLYYTCMYVFLMLMFQSTFPVVFLSACLLFICGLLCCFLCFVCLLVLLKSCVACVLFLCLVLRFLVMFAFVRFGVRFLGENLNREGRMSYGEGYGNILLCCCCCCFLGGGGGDFVCCLLLLLLNSILLFLCWLIVYVLF